MTKISIKMADSRDRPAILAFIAEHWQAQHIFVESPDVFDWQYRAPDGGYHMAIAHSGDKMLGILGYIPTGRFDPKLGFGEIMLAIWKVREDIAPPSLGLGLLKLIEKTHAASVIGAIGISDMVVPIYKAFKYTVGTLEHVALIPQRHADFAIAHGAGIDAVFREGEDKAVLTVLRNRPDHSIRQQIDSLAGGLAGLQKSWAYIEERYLNHPWYSYSVATIGSEQALQSVLVWRRVKVDGASILRIVDVVGDIASLAQVANALAQIVRDADAEYIDLLGCGFEMAGLRAAGFASPSWNIGLILPNYFAPFEQRNIEIKFAYKADRPLCLFRADSDQDRPNCVTDLAQRT